MEGGSVYYQCCVRRYCQSFFEYYTLRGIIMPKDIREIRITIKGDGKGEEDASDVADSAGSSESSGTKGGASSSSLSKMAWGAFAARTVADIGAEMIAWADYEIDKSFSLKDDYIGQRRMALAEFQIQGAVAGIQKVAGYSIQGAIAGGPIGALFGAMVGVAMRAQQVDRSNKQGNEQQNINIAQMNVQLQYTRRRAGWSLNAASIGEDL